MKPIILLSAISCLILTCKAQKRAIPTPGKEVDFLTLTLHEININDSTTVNFTIENKSREPIYLNNPASFGNTRLVLYKGNRELYGIRVRLNMKNVNMQTLLQPHSKLDIKYEYLLNKVFHLSKEDSVYTLYLSYKGNVMDSSKTILYKNTGVRSNTLKFSY